MRCCSGDGDVNDLLLVAIVIAIEPLPIIGFILVLGTDRGTRNGAAFIAAWVACLVAIIIATLLVTGGEPLSTSSTPATGVSVATLLIGIALVVYAAYRQRQPPSTKPPAEPSWMRRLDGMKAGGAAVLGVALQPWPLVAAAAADVSRADLSNAWSIVALVLFCVVATSVLATMEIYSLVAPAAAAAKLDRLHSWIDRHRARAITILAAIVGSYLVVKGVLQLVTR